MSPDELRQAVAMVDGRLVTEASGNVSRNTVAVLAATGVDYISSGELTHSYRSIDVGLDF
jgi:nicotinate-nucleotide pyrophosphorylase (carboxylating)